MSNIKIQEQLKKFNVEKQVSNRQIKFREGRWSKEEHAIFIEETLKIGIKNWKKLEDKIKTRNNCQIRSHFQKYIKKICSKYNLKRTLTEIFLDEKSLNKISELDRKIIEIFNSYKKTQVISRKSKMRALFRKRLAKKKFFKIKREGEEKKVLEENSVNNKFKETIRNIPVVTNFNNELTNCTSLLEVDPGSKKCISQKFEEISVMNKIFIEKFLNFNYEYENTMKLFQSFICYYFVFSRSLDNIGCNTKK